MMRSTSLPLSLSIHPANPANPAQLSYPIRLNGENPTSHTPQPIQDSPRRIATAAAARDDSPVVMPAFIFLVYLTNWGGDCYDGPGCRPPTAPTTA